MKKEGLLDENGKPTAKAGENWKKGTQNQPTETVNADALKNDENALELVRY